MEDLKAQLCDEHQTLLETQNKLAEIKASAASRTQSATAQESLPQIAHATTRITSSSNISLENVNEMDQDQLRLYLKTVLLENAQLKVKLQNMYKEVNRLLNEESRRIADCEISASRSQSARRLWTCRPYRGPGLRLAITK